jgi:hypothetical protein
MIVTENLKYLEKLNDLRDGIDTPGSEMRQAIEGKRKKERKRERKKKERKREMLQMAVMERFNDASLPFPR